MMISLLLGKQIAAMLLMVFMGFAIVRMKILSVQDSRALSAIALYIAGPCMVLDAFQLEYSPERMQGLILSVAAAAFALFLALGLNFLIRKPLDLDPVEQTSALYSNSGNLIIPIVIYVFGQEWVLYTSGFLLIQTILFWTHCSPVLQKNARINIWKILLNVNMLAVFAGAIMFMFGLRLPEVPAMAVHAVGVMIGPLCMIVTGMLIGSMEFSRLRVYRKLPLIVGLRLIFYPLLTLIAFRLSGMSGWVENGETIVMISFFAASAPVASSITQMAHIYGRNGEYASLINVVSTLLCVFSMPVLAWMFQW
ncbi:MAG: AEC family transporter [Mailhella sp.]|nr:AEC family transporter [Mailhella sp.]